MRKYGKAMGLVILMLLLSVNTVHGAMNFKDVKTTDWFKKDLDMIITDSRHILEGYPDGTYKPTGQLQVDQFIKCVVTAAGNQVTQPTTGYWAQNHINKAIELGYIKSTDFTNYKKTITRAEMATIITQVIKDLESVTYSKTAQISSELLDSITISAKHKDNVMKVYELGIITGYPDGTFKPNNTLTRAEATAVLRRLIDKTARKPFTTTNIDFSQHFKGGSKWIDPVKGSDELNVPEDLAMVKSKKMFFDDSGSYTIEDHLSVIIKYSENEYPVDQLKDIERLLLRRLSVDNTKIIMDYIINKKGWYTFLDQKRKVYNMEEYSIHVVDDLDFEGLPFQRSTAIEIQMWYKY